VKRREAAYLRKLAGEASRDRGKVAEEALVAAARKAGECYPWFISARPATKEEDNTRGIDVVVETTRGPVYLQSKSSYAGRRRVEDKTHVDEVHVVVVSLNDALTVARVAEVFDVVSRGKGVERG